MEPIKEMCYGYDVLEASFGLSELARADDDDWQGDSVVLLRSADGRLGILEYGWGSCSGCDALQACDTVEEVNDLRDSLFESIKWFDSATACLEYVKSKDVEVQALREPWTVFVGRAVSALDAIGK